MNDRLDTVCRKLDEFLLGRNLAAAKLWDEGRITLDELGEIIAGNNSFLGEICETAYAE